MFKHSVEVKLSFVETKERNKKGNPIKRPVVHRKMYLDGVDEIFGIDRWRVVMVRRAGEPYFSTSYIPPPKKESYWDKGIPCTEFVREKEPNGKVTPAYTLEGILQWLKWRVTDPVACLTDLLTAVPVKASEDDLEEAA